MNQLQVFSPYDGMLLKEFPLEGAKQLDNKLKSASQFLRPENRLSVPKRVEILERTAKAIQDNREKYARDAASEGGKPLTDSLVEIDRATLGIREAARCIPEINGQMIPMNLNQASQNRIAFTLKQPRGIAAAIGAFNHPFNIAVHQIVPGIAVGAPVLVKPSLETPLSCLNLLSQLHEAGLPEEFAQSLLCDNKVSEMLAGHRDISYLNFIGSSKVGWHLRSQLPPGATCTLEHGGAAPVIIESDADLQQAIPGLVRGGFYHAGQVCVSVQRIYVHKNKLSEFVEAYTEKAKALKVGDPASESTDVGPLIRRGEVERIHEWVQQATQAGAELLCGGCPRGNTCYEPTVLLNPPTESNVSQKEIFGPVVCIYSYEDTLDAIEQANALPYKFQASVFSENIHRAMDIAERLKGVTVLINDHTAFRVDWMPFGASEESGLGTGGIKYTMEDMSEEKTLIIKRNPPKYS